MLKRTLFLLFGLGCFHFLQAQLTLPPSGGNQKSVVTQYIGAAAHVTIIYNSPDVTAPNGTDRKGKIWGQLVPYGMSSNSFGSSKEIPWRAGANENTVIKFSHDMIVQGKPIKAGKYGFHIIPKENGPWTLIFSKNASAWGSYYYKESEDVLRVETTPKEAPWLSFEFTDRQPTQTTVGLFWENLEVPFTISVPQIDDIHLAIIRDELSSSTGFNWNAWVTAVNYCVGKETNLEEALTWADMAVSAPFIGQENFTTLSTKASVLMKLKRNDEAVAVMDKAMRHSTASPFQIHQYGRQLIAQGEKEKALEVMTYNYEHFEAVWPTHVGMARAYSAVGKYDKAITHAEKALAQAPDKLNKDNLSKMIESLKEKKDVN